ncbi:MAG: hypothetical protein AAGK22_18875 [Acidobacteriota bacterium]
MFAQRNGVSWLVLALALVLAALSLVLSLSVRRLSRVETLPLEAVEELAFVRTCDRASGAQPEGRVPYGSYLEAARRTDLFRSVSVIDDLGAGLDLELFSSATGQPFLARSVRLSPGALAALGARYVLGGGFEDGRGVVLSEHTWRERFAADRSVLGTFLRVGEEQLPVVGVLAAEANLSVRLVGQRQSVDVYTPLPRSTAPGLMGYLVVVRLLPEVAAAVANETLAATTPSVGGRTLCLVPLTADPALQELDDQLVLAAWLATIFAGIAASLALVMSVFHAASRWREVSVRLALGGTPREISVRLTMRLLGPPVVAAGLAVSLLVLILNGLAIRVDFSAFRMPLTARWQDVAIVVLTVAFGSLSCCFCVVAAVARGLQGRLAMGRLGTGSVGAVSIGWALGLQAALVVLVGAPMVTTYRTLKTEFSSYDSVLNQDGTYYMKLAKAELDEPGTASLLRELSAEAHVEAVSLATGAPFSPGYWYYQRRPDASLNVQCRVVFAGDYFGSIGLRSAVPGASPGDVFASANALIEGAVPDNRELWRDEETSYRYRSTVPALPSAGDTRERPCVFVAATEVRAKMPLLVVRSIADASTVERSVKSALTRSGVDGWIQSVREASVLASDETRVARALLASLTLAFSIVGTSLVASVIFVLGQQLAESQPELAVRVALGARSSDIERSLLARAAFRLCLGCLLAVGVCSLVAPRIEALATEAASSAVTSLFLSGFVVASSLSLCWLSVRRFYRQFGREGLSRHLSS